MTAKGRSNFREVLWACSPGKFRNFSPRKYVFQHSGWKTKGFSLLKFKRILASKQKKLTKRSTVIEARSSLYKQIYACCGS